MVPNQHQLSTNGDARGAPGLQLQRGQAPRFPNVTCFFYVFFVFYGFFNVFFKVFFTKPGLAMEVAGDFGAGYLGGLL